MVWIAGLAGLLIGSFLNVCINRWPEGESVITPRSRCPECERPIAWCDNIPVLSYLLLRGRCRGCGTRISIQYPLIEVATGLIWSAAAARYGLTLDAIRVGSLDVETGIEALRSAVFLTLLLGIAMTDAKRMLIPYQLSLGGAALGVAMAAVPGGFPLPSALIGAVVGWVAFWLVSYGGEKLFRKPALGLGDVDMMAMLGAFLGIQGALVTVFLGSFLGLLIGVPLTMARGRLELLKTYLPLGTFLAMGGAIVHIWGREMIDWYVGTVLGLG